MNNATILPYSQLQGQESLKLALEISHIEPRMGGVLLSGERGTGKSTAVRAFAQLLSNEFPVTLPINATEDRVIGGWDVRKMIDGDAEWKRGLLEEAHEKVLYIDEVNLLDDHIVNIILDAASTGVLVMQREGEAREKTDLRFILSGSMNPEEGGLRPQLLDRFGLLVNVSVESEHRLEVLNAVLAYESNDKNFIAQAHQKNDDIRQELVAAKALYPKVIISDEIKQGCIGLAKAFKVEGHRADYTMALAAKACAARKGKKEVLLEHLKQVAPLALQHRRPEFLQNSKLSWTEKDDETLAETLGL